MRGVRVVPRPALSGGTCDRPQRRTIDAPTRPVGAEAVEPLPPAPAVRTPVRRHGSRSALRRPAVAPGDIGSRSPSPPYLPTPFTRLRRLVGSRGRAAVHRSLPARCAADPSRAGPQPVGPLCPDGVGNQPEGATASILQTHARGLMGAATNGPAVGAQSSEGCPDSEHSVADRRYMTTTRCVPSSSGCSSERSLVKKTTWSGVYLVRSHLSLDIILINITKGKIT